MPTLALLAAASAATLALTDPDPALVQIAASHLSGLDACGTATAGQLAATVSVVHGEVISVSLSESNLEPDGRVCVLGNLFTWRFPEQTSATIPLAFKFAPVPPLPQAHVTVVGRVVRANSGQIRRCYEQALHTNPDLTGALEATVGISEGQISRVVLSSGLDDGLQTCVDRRLRSWQFPEDVSGEIVLPFSFNRPTSG